MVGAKAKLKTALAFGRPTPVERSSIAASERDVGLSTIPNCEMVKSAAGDGKADR